MPCILGIIFNHPLIYKLSENIRKECLPCTLKKCTPEQACDLFIQMSLNMTVKKIYLSHQILCKLCAIGRQLCEFKSVFCRWDCNKYLQQSNICGIYRGQEQSISQTLLGSHKEQHFKVKNTNYRKSCELDRKFRINAKGIQLSVELQNEIMKIKTWEDSPSR